MKKNLLISLKLTLVMIILCAVLYPLLVAGIGRATPGGGKGKTVSVNGKVVGYEKVGQKFTDEVINHPNVRATPQSNGRILYEVDDMGRTTGKNQQGQTTRGGAVVVEGPNPKTWSTSAPDEVVTQYPK